LPVITHVSAATAAFFVFHQPPDCVPQLAKNASARTPHIRWFFMTAA